MKILADRLAQMRHARCATHQHHAVHVVYTKIRIAQRLARGGHGLCHQVLGNFSEFGGREFQMHLLATGKRCVDVGLVLGRQQFLRFACLDHQEAGVFMRQGRQFGLFDNPAKQAMVKVIAAQCRIAAGGQHFKHAFG